MPYNFVADSIQFSGLPLCQSVNVRGTGVSYAGPTSWNSLPDGLKNFNLSLQNVPFAFLSSLPFGGLGATYNVHLRLIGKRVVDFLLVLIELHC